MVVRFVQNASSQASIARDASAAGGCTRLSPCHEHGLRHRCFVASRPDREWQGVAANVQARATLQDAPLAVYPLAQQQKSSLFTSAVSHLLQQVISRARHTASYLHATTHQQQHRAAELQPGDTWGEVITRMGMKDTQLLMYVKPVHDPTDFCGESVQGTHCADRCHVGKEHIEGSVGECCDEEHQEEWSSPHLETPDLDVDWAYMNSKGLDVQYYGVVAQNIAYPSGNGCYLLKTTTEKRGNPACHCMHYSLMRVCEGRALAEQMSDFWTREFR
eukprot:jgi/Ulvmu1/5250/UM022_0043.1